MSIAFSGRVIRPADAAQHFHLMLSDTPYCEFTDCQAGMELQRLSGVTACSYSDADSALLALRRLVDRGKINAQMVAGRCPHEEAHAAGRYAGPRAQYVMRVISSSALDETVLYRETLHTFIAVLSIGLDYYALPDARAREIARNARTAVELDQEVKLPLTAWRAERAAWPTFQVTAAYPESGGGGIWCDLVQAMDSDHAGEIARQRMALDSRLEAYERDRIDILDCAEIDPEAEAAKAVAVQLRDALQAFADAYCPPDGSQMEWETCNDAYQHALTVLASARPSP